MSKSIFLSIALLSFSVLTGQTPGQGSAPEFPHLQKEKTIAPTGPIAPQNQLLSKSSQGVIWSEGFYNGIPASWSNQGYTEDSLGNLTTNPDCKWEFRSLQTTPDNTVGSRGYYNGGTSVIQSLTAFDFIIFDSGYLDNDSTSNQGSGRAPAPHIGTLTTDDIDLSSYPNLELFMITYARRFVAEYEIAFSRDGGQTFPDTILALPQLGVNNSTRVNDTILIDVSTYIGGVTDARIAFIFDGGSANNTNPNGDGYYFWMLDDITLMLPGTVSLAENSSLDHFQLYPNPAHSELTISSIAPKNLMAGLYDIAGKCVKKFSLSEGENLLDISALSKGIYQLYIDGIAGSLAFSKE